jgi:putative heme-binding domain-containing protein
MRWCFPLISLSLAVIPTVFAGGQSKDKPKWAPSPHIAATEALRPEAQLKKFRLPPGFEIQLVASDPDIRKPINIAFDTAGRLWVTETIEYPFPAGPGKGRDAVKILEDFDENGKACKITTFADGLNIPIGVLPLSPRVALVYSIPSIYWMTDLDGKGKAGSRGVLFTGYGFGDTHGMTGEFVQGFDGWVYACHGYANTSKVRQEGGEATLTMQSGNTYRFTPGGARLEYFTHGQVNPFGLCFDPLGNLYSCDCHTQPIYQLLHGAYYPSFGKPHDGMGFGPEMLSHYAESTAIAGIAYYAADQYPRVFRDCAFIGDVVTNRVNQFRIAWHGSTPKASLERFLQCDDAWFRPVDVKLGPDGCLYVADFYNRIIGHYEVPLEHPGRDRDKGRIWRIVYRGPDGQSVSHDPKGSAGDLTQRTPAELVKLLDSSNLTVRLQATQELVNRGGDKGARAVREAMSKGTAVQKAHGLWVLYRTGNLEPGMLFAASRDKGAIVRVHAQRVLTEHDRLTPAQRNLVLAGLKDEDPLVQRCAAEALGTHPQPENLAPLLELRHRVPTDDTHLLHVVRMAMRDQLRLAATWKTLNPDALSEEDLRALADVCPGVHNEAAAGFLLTVLNRFKLSRDEFQRYMHAVVRHGAPALIPSAVAVIGQHFSEDPSTQAVLLKTVQQASQERGQKLGDKEKRLAETVAGHLLASPDPKQVQNGIELASAFKLLSAQPALLDLARDTRAPEAIRKSAVTTAVSIEPAKAVKVLGEVLLNDKEAIAVREQVAIGLASTNQSGAHAALLKAMEAAPARLQTVIALGLAGSPQGGQGLLEAIAKGKASPRVLQDRAVELKLRQAKLANLDQRLAKLTKGLPAADQRSGELIAKRRDGFLASKADSAAGAKVFEKHCANCHQIANKGAKIGPQLDGIGIRGVERLLEDVLDPNRNVDQAFRSTTLVLDNGQFVSGLVLREEGEVIVLADAQGKEQRVPKGTVEERIVSQLSPMPSNLAEQISEPDLYHLLAYLLAQRAKE